VPRRDRRVIALWCVISVVAASALVYVVDDASVRSRIARGTAGGPLEDVRFYYATALKSGKLEVFWDQPQYDVCVRSLFPHLGHDPCWYAHRRTVKEIR
jgi:hypothetical protein